MVFLTEFVLVLRDIALAIAGIFGGPRRRHYEHVVEIAAPRAVVWRMLRARDLTYDGMFPMHVVTETVAGRPDIERAQVRIGQRVMPMTTRIATEVPHETLLLEILSEGTDPAVIMGRDDYIGIFLGDNPQNSSSKGTRMVVTRDLEPTKWTASLSVPFGLRIGARRYKATAERMARDGTAAPADDAAKTDTPANGEASATVEPPAVGSAMKASSFGLTPNGLLFSAIALASFSYLWGWKQALLLSAIILLHELGHALAMLMVGIPVKGVYLVPFFGGAAIAGAPYRNEGQNGFVALMGPGFSLVPTLAFALAARETGSADWKLAADLSAIVNLVNLAPIFPLDGGQVLKAVLVSVNRWLAQVAGFAGAAAGLWGAWVLRDPLLGVFMILGLLAASQIRKPSTVAPMRWPGALLLFVAFLATIAAYVAVLYAGQRATS